MLTGSQPRFWPMALWVFDGFWPHDRHSRGPLGPAAGGGDAPGGLPPRHDPRGVHAVELRAPGDEPHRGLLDVGFGEQKYNFPLAVQWVGISTTQPP